jgi:pSer/pThr/pTyr-binding forkhead associated (FHA) protein
VQLNDRNISDFHAEICIDENSILIVDFNSEKGTFVNEERITKEKHLTAGDRIQMGSTHAVFLALNAIIAKECKPKVNVQEVFKNLVSHCQKWSIDKKVNINELLNRLKPHCKKWMTEKNKKILACGLPIVAVTMIALLISKNRNVGPIESAPQHDKTARSTHIGNDGNNKEKKKIESAQHSAGEVENGLSHQIPANEVVASGRVQQVQPVPGRQDRFSDIYFSIANKFADEQLWRIALEYYHRVFEKELDNPEISARIAEMESEIENQLIFEEGQAFLKENNYQKGIANLQRITKKSFYFDAASQAIAEAKAKMAQTNNTN